ncbi:MAG: site-2 protease family protein [Armatimonadetes bacterium]|nr:site-2 protease family protein [Anaerolineae bacterium]
MLHESADRAYERAPQPEQPETDGSTPPRAADDSRLTQIREAVAQVMLITEERAPRPEQTAPDDPFNLPTAQPTREDKVDADENVAPLVLNPESRLIISFEGQFRLATEPAYSQLDALLAPLDLVALFRQTEVANQAPKQRIYVVQGRVNPKPRSWIPNALLLAVTLLSVLFVGMQMALNEIAYTDLPLAERLSDNGFAELWRGLPYALSILLILGAHELGHYFAARRHNINVTLPYFLPAPGPISLFGTFGAFIQLRQPIRNRKMLLEIGAAGPLAGLVFAVPILLIGLATSRVDPLLTGGYMEGNSILYALAKIVVFGRFLPDGVQDVIVNQMAWAGWTGLFVTGLNLIPIGQLDGGHVLYSLLGSRTRKLFIPLMVILTALVLVSGGGLLILLLMLFLLGRNHAVPLDDITPLDREHRWLAIGTLAVFILVFVPIPLTLVVSQAPLLPVPGAGSVWLPIVAAVGVALWQRVRR